MVATMLLADRPCRAGEGRPPTPASDAAWDMTGAAAPPTLTSDAIILGGPGQPDYRTAPPNLPGGATWSLGDGVSTLDAQGRDVLMLPPYAGGQPRTIRNNGYTIKNFGKVVMLGLHLTIDDMFWNLPRLRAGDGAVIGPSGRYGGHIRLITLHCGRAWLRAPDAVHIEGCHFNFENWVPGAEVAGYSDIIAFWGLGWDDDPVTHFEVQNSRLGCAGYFNADDADPGSPPFAHAAPHSDCIQAQGGRTYITAPLRLTNIHAASNYQVFFVPYKGFYQAGKATGDLSPDGRPGGFQPKPTWEFRRVVAVGPSGRQPGKVHGMYALGGQNKGLAGCCHGSFENAWAGVGGSTHRWGAVLSPNDLHRNGRADPYLAPFRLSRAGQSLVAGSIHMFELGSTAFSANWDSPNAPVFAPASAIGINYASPWPQGALYQTGKVS